MKKAIDEFMQRKLEKCAELLLSIKNLKQILS